MNFTPRIVGIAGAFGSGKSTAAELLKVAGYEHISLGEFLEEELQKRGVQNITRKALQDIGNEWRDQFGSAVLTEKALEHAKAKGYKKIVIEGFRNPDEIKRLRKEKDFILLSLVVNRQTRFERLQSVKRREELTRETFEQLDDRDLGIGEGKKGLQTAICVMMADIFIDNNQDIQSLKNKLTKEVK